MEQALTIGLFGVALGFMLFVYFNELKKARILKERAKLIKETEDLMRNIEEKIKHESENYEKTRESYHQSLVDNADLLRGIRVPDPTATDVNPAPDSGGGPKP